MDVLPGFQNTVVTGQVLFIIGVVSLMALLHRLPIKLSEASWRLVPYSLASLASFWVSERMISFL